MKAPRFYPLMSSNLFHTPFGRLLLFESAFIKTRLIVPPMAPPTACNTENKATPPNVVIRKLGFVKRFPIIKPAIAVEAVDVKSRLITLVSVSLNSFRIQ